MLYFHAGLRYQFSGTGFRRRFLYVCHGHNVPVNCVNRSFHTGFENVDTEEKV